RQKVNLDSHLPLCIIASRMKSALVVVDMQRYYLDATAAFCRYHESCEPGCLSYIRERCSELVIPNIQLLVDAFHGAELPVIYLRLCGIKPDRSDLHPHFRRAYEKGLALGFEGIYPLQSEDESRVIDALAVE